MSYLAIIKDLKIVQVSYGYQNIFNITPVTNKNAPHIRVVKKKFFPSSLGEVLSISISSRVGIKGSESLAS